MTNESSPEIRFFHRDGRHKIRDDLDLLVGPETTIFQGAVAYFTKAGYLFLETHKTVLRCSDSFFVASVDYPTDLDALENLHRLAPESIYIHLGAVTPVEHGIGRALMHSKIILAVGIASRVKLWVGSHNLTAQALQGGNFEAGLQITASLTDSFVQDAKSHLRECRRTAQLFDPSRMELYRGLQKKRQRGFGKREDILVIHAEAEDHPTQAPFTVHVRLIPTEFDNYFQTDKNAHVYLYPKGALAPGKPVDQDPVQFWVGQITSDVRTDLHPRNRGIEGEFPAADFEVDIPDLNTPPVFVRAGMSGVSPVTQAVLRMDRQSRLGQYVYSVRDAPLLSRARPAGTGEREHGPLDRDMAGFFTRESKARDRRLIYEPVDHVERNVEIRAYPETMPREADLRTVAPRGEYSLVRKEIEPKYPVDPFFFVSKHYLGG